MKSLLDNLLYPTLNSKIRFICFVSNGCIIRYDGINRYTYKDLTFTHHCFGDKTIIDIDGVIIRGDIWVKEVPKSCKKKIKSTIIDLWEQALETKKTRDLINDKINKETRLNAIKQLCGEK
jgi:hypothetical protein